MHDTLSPIAQALKAHGSLAPDTRPTDAEVMRACVYLAHVYGQTLGIDWQRTADPGRVLVDLAACLGAGRP